MKYPNKLLMIVTKECNRQCAFCIDKPNKKYYKNYKPFIEIETVEQILEFSKKHNIKTIALNGGEPTLHPQIVEIAKMIKTKGFQSEIFTNYDFKDVIKQLDGIIDVIRISYYGPMQFPNQKEFQSKIVLNIMLTKQTFPTYKQLVDFIEENKNNFFDIRIHTLIQNNQYSIDNQVDYLDYINEHYPLKRNEKGDYYHEFMGYQIEREDLPNTEYDIKQKLYKAHMDGTISHYFEEDHYKIGGMNQDDAYTKVLRAYRNKQKREEISKAYKSGHFNIDDYVK